MIKQAKGELKARPSHPLRDNRAAAGFGGALHLHEV